MNHVTWYWNRLRNNTATKKEARAFMNRVRTAQITHRRNTEMRDLRREENEHSYYVMMRKKQNASVSVAKDPAIFNCT